MAALATQDGWQHIVKTDRALEQAGEVAVGCGGARQGRDALRRGTLRGSCGQRCGSLATHF